MRDDAHKSADLATISALRAGVHIYFAKNKEFPDTEDELKACLEDGKLPDGWTITWNNGGTPDDPSDDTATITCNGLPSTGATQSWTYTVADGSITMVDGGHGF